MLRPAVGSLQTAPTALGVGATAELTAIADEPLLRITLGGDAAMDCDTSLRGTNTVQASCRLSSGAF